MFKQVTTPLICVRCENTEVISLDMEATVSINRQLADVLLSIHWGLNDVDDEILCGTCLQEMRDESNFPEKYEKE